MRFLQFGVALSISLWLCVVLGTGAGAQADTQADGQKGRVTGLPIPRWVSMKAAEGNVRRGPDLHHRIDWVFQHQNMPLQVIDEFEHWRRVVDFEGQGGWMHFRLLSGVRTVVFMADVTLYKKPSAEAEPLGSGERGAIAFLEACTPDWCRVSKGGVWGWMEKPQIWGAGVEEVFE